MIKLGPGRALFLGLALVGAGFLASPGGWGMRGMLIRADDQASLPTPAGQMTIEQVGQALDKYGKNTATDNGQTTFSLTVTRGKWDLNIIVSLSPNHTIIWMTNQLASIADPTKASPAALVNLLEKNEDIGPMFFGMVGPRHSLLLSNPVPNHDLTPAALQDQVEALISNVLDTEPLWRPEVLVPK
jgi:hypothetical protein